MRACLKSPMFALVVFSICLVFSLCLAGPRCAFATGAESVTEPEVDPTPCLAAISVADDDKIVTASGELIDNDKTVKDDRVKALIARAAVLGRRDQIDRAIADYDGALSADASLADIYNARGELWRRKGDRPRALRDFGAAIKLNPAQQAARAGRFSVAPRRVVRPRRLRPAESHARAAGSSAGCRAALAEEAGVFGLNQRRFA